MRSISIVLAGVLVVALAACGSESDSGSGTGTGGAKSVAPFPDAQAVVDRVAARHADLQRLTLHAVPTGKAAPVQLASTMPERRGKPSDPEDLQAMQSGKEVVLDEAGALDVTVPILVKDGKATAVAGVTLRMAAAASRDDTLAKARSIAQELEKEITGSAKPLW